MDLHTYLLIYLLIFLCLVFVLPSWRTWRATGIVPVVFGRGDGLPDFIGKVMAYLMVLLVLAAVLPLVGAGVWTGSIRWALGPRVQVAGMVLMHVALAWVVVAQHQMGDSWRIGIDKANKTSLRDKGLFSVSRNPVFLGLLAGLAGYVLAQPGTLTLLVGAMTWLTLQVQVRLEESHLEETHGEHYRSYKRKVRRWC
jgi:protein-S-isoprenylcysteine O-methyltransferase Ste14